MTSKPQSIPKGYAQFLSYSSAKRKEQQEWLADVLAEAIFGDELGEDEFARTLRHAANHVLIVLEAAGWDLVFGDDGEYRWVVT